MVVAGVNANFQKSVSGLNARMSANAPIMTNRIGKINSLSRGDSVSFSGKPEAAEEAMIKLTEKAGAVFNGLLIKARELAAKRLGLLNKADISKVEVDAVDIKNAMDFFVKRGKSEIHVGYEGVLERMHNVDKSASEAMKTAKQSKSDIPHIGYLSILERDSAKGSEAA